jgi:hypothetical protein
MTRQEQMFALIEEAAQSKETITAFCAAREIKMKTFFYWRRKLLASRSTPAGFIPIAPPCENTAVRLSYPNGVDIHLPSADPALIAQLIHLI